MSAGTHHPDAPQGVVVAVLRGGSYRVQFDGDGELRCSLHRVYAGDRITKLPRKKQIRLGDRVRVVQSSEQGVGLIFEKLDR